MSLPRGALDVRGEWCDGIRASLCLTLGFVITGSCHVSGQRGSSCVIRFNVVLMPSGACKYRRGDRSTRSTGVSWALSKAVESRASAHVGIKIFGCHQLRLLVCGCSRFSGPKLAVFLHESSLITSRVLEQRTAAHENFLSSLQVSQYDFQASK